LNVDEKNINEKILLNFNANPAHMPWNEQNAPISIIVKGKRVKSWQEYNHSAGRIPRSPVSVDGDLEEVKLIPYGSTTLRIAQFPVCKN
jgi:hypothetical protein